MNSATQETPASGTNGLALLPLPSLDRLTEQQVRGTACVWDGVALTTETAVDLGSRRERRLDGEYQWFPRSCLRCVGEKALLALFEHTEKCAEGCRRAKENSACDTGRALVRLSIRKGR